MQIQSKSSRQTSPILSGAPTTRSPVKFAYAVNPHLPLRVNVCIGGWWPGARKTGEVLGQFSYSGIHGSVWVPWEYASWPVVLHEGVHLGMWAANFARDQKKLAAILPRSVFGTVWRQGTDAVREEFLALVVENYANRCAIALSNRGESLPGTLPFDGQTKEKKHGNRSR